MLNNTKSNNQSTLCTNFRYVLMPYVNSKLTKTFVFWCLYEDQKSKKDFYKKQNEEEFSKRLKEIAEFNTIEHFWEIFQHLKKPENMGKNIEIMLFKKNIKPIWEDTENKNGGQMTIKINKEYSSTFWEEFILTFIGNILPKPISESINGINFKILANSEKPYNIFQIWFKDYSKAVFDYKIEGCIRKFISIPDVVKIKIEEINKKIPKEKAIPANYGYMIPTVIFHNNKYNSKNYNNSFIHKSSSYYFSSKPKFVYNKYKKYVPVELPYPNSEQNKENLTNN